ncbi:MAG: TadE/TadG family type IV pilus assembly protein [Gemmatimonadaceae bacterium]
MARVLGAGRKFLIREQRGQALVEFAIVAGVIFIPLVFGIIEFGRLIWAKNMVTAAAREGARYAIVRGSSNGFTLTTADVSTYVTGRTKIAPINVTAAWAGAHQPGDVVTVTVSYAYTPVVRVIPSKTVTGTSKQVVW